MAGGESLASAGALTGVVIFLVYAPVCLLAFRWFLPRLPASFRLLALAMLSAQVVILLIALQSAPRWELQGWLWNLDQEWNIPSVFASAQLALVAGSALMAALLAGAERPANRLYVVAIAGLFFFLAWDEFFALHETNRHWKSQYLALGAAVAMATLALARREAQRARQWRLLFLAGIALSGAGAMIFKLLPHSCPGFVMPQHDLCLQFDAWEESAEFLGVWLALVAMLGSLSRAAATGKAPAAVALFLLPFLWTLLLIHDALLPRFELRFRATHAAVQFESGLRLLGYNLTRNEEAIVLWLYPSAWRSDYHELGISLHLIDQASGESVASRDIHAPLQERLLLAPGYAHVYRQPITLAIPPETPKNRAFWLTLSLWRAENDAFIRQRALESDLKLLSETQVLIEELVLPAATTGASATPVAAFDNGFTLNETRLPKRVAAGRALPVPFSWAAESDGAADFVQFLHFVHEESGAWQGYDQQPLGARLPTRLWYGGLAESETWQIPLPADLAPGPYQVFTGLYRPLDGERLGVSDIHGRRFTDARVPLGRLIIEGSA